MRLIFVGLLLSVCSSAFAQDGELSNVPKSSKSTGDKNTTTQSCPDGRKLRNFCMYVDGKQEDLEPLDGYNFVYQRKLLEAACVDVTKDSEQIVAEKMRKMWKQFENQLVCNSLRFDVQNGSVVKYASIIMFDAFIRDLARWKVDLNRVDASDGMTALDYVKVNMEKTQGTETHRKLSFYYDLLRKAGAKHRSEL